MAFYASDTGDWLENMVNLLNDNWIRGNITGNITPKIRLITDSELPKRLDFGRSDYVLIYEEGSDEVVADIGYYGVVKRMDIALDIRTGKGRIRINQLYAEIERIVKTNRKNPTDSDGDSIGVSYYIWRGSTDLTNKLYRNWRYVAKVEAHKGYEAV